MKCDRCTVPPGHRCIHENDRAGCERAFAGFPVGDDTRVIVAIEACDFRRSSCGCLCKPALCLLGGEPAIVTFEDCRACVYANASVIKL